jgi:hypothetical protein
LPWLRRFAAEVPGRLCRRDNGPGDIDKLFSKWAYGWHRVTYYGDRKEPVAELSKALNITLTEEA